MPCLLDLDLAPLLNDSIQRIDQSILMMFESELNYVGVETLLLKVRFLSELKKDIIDNQR